MLVEDFGSDVSDGYRMAMHLSVQGSLLSEDGKAFANLPARFHLHVSSL